MTIERRSVADHAAWLVDLGHFEAPFRASIRAGIVYYRILYYIVL